MNFFLSPNCLQEFFFLQRSFARYFFLNDLKIFSGMFVEKFVDGGGVINFFLIVVKHLFNVLE